MMTTWKWSAVREVPAADLQPGDTFIKAAAFTAYRTHGDGTVSPFGWTDLEGVQIDVTARNGAEVTGRFPDGTETSQTAPDGARVLRLVKA